MMKRAASWAPIDLILDAVANHSGTIRQLMLGLTWTSCAVDEQIGLAMSPGTATRVLDWPGTLAGRRASDVSRWIASWNPFEATVGLAAANAIINHRDNPLLSDTSRSVSVGAGNLAVFEHFRPRLDGKRIVVIGRYPGLDRVLDGLDAQVLERNPGGDDLPDPAAEYLLPDADWVFLTATSLINKTFPRLAELARDAVTVLMGPSTPWLEQWSTFGIDYLAGIQVIDPRLAEQVVAEGGGTRLFDGAVGYRVVDIGGRQMDILKREIADTFARRDTLKAEMAAWYDAGNHRRFPRQAELLAVDDALARLDSCYKRQWDARQLDSN